MEDNNYQYEIMKDLQGFFKPGDRKKIYNECDSLRDKLLVRVLWKSGRRIGEVLKLQVKDIDFDGKGIVWHIDKKTKKVDGERTKFDLRKWKPQDVLTLDILKYHIEQEELRPDDYIFQSPFKNNKPITRQRADQIIKRICERIGIYRVGDKKPHCHNFRHSFAVYGVKNAKNPGDIRKLQMILEHANLNITSFYLQFADEDTREIMEADND